MPSLARLFLSAHENSALRRKFPTGCHAGDLPGWLEDTNDVDNQTNTGFPDDWDPDAKGNAHGNRWSASAYSLPSANDEHRDEASDSPDDDDPGAAAVLFDLGANLPPNNPFAAQPLTRIAA